MNNFKSCIPCVCTGSGHKQVYEEHDTNTANFIGLSFLKKEPYLIRDLNFN